MIDFKHIPASPPRPVSQLPGLKYSASFDKRGLFFVGSIVLVFCLFPVLIFFSGDKAMRLSFIEMKSASAEITQLKQSSKCDRESHSIHYRFMAQNGRMYYGSYTMCTDSPYSDLIVGDSIPVSYDPDDPSFNGIEGELGKNKPPFFIFAFFPLMAMMFFVPSLFPNLKQVRKARSIFRKGHISQGEIVFVKRRKSVTPFEFKSSPGMEVFYQFTDDKGNRIESHMSMDNDWLVNRWAIGSGITVSYIKGKPQKSIILDGFYR